MNLDKARQASRLSGREKEILELLARGDSIQEIASYLQLDDEDEATVRIHVLSIIEKLRLRIRIQTQRVEEKERREAAERERRAR